LIDKALRHLRLLGIELIRDRQDDVPGEGAGLIGAVVGAVVVLAVWSMIAKNRAL
jgi:uncharacterized membrane protein YeaQ/YmgE (transglycosylase-associated protein family)